MRRLALLFPLIFVLNCASSVEKTMSSWVDAPVSALVDSWGAPASVVPDGKGGQIYVYRQYVDAGTVYGPTYAFHSGWWRVREFYVDKKGYIYKYRWSGT